MFSLIISTKHETLAISNITEYCRETTQQGMEDTKNSPSAIDMTAGLIPTGAILIKTEATVREYLISNETKLYLKDELGNTLDIIQ